MIYLSDRSLVKISGEDARAFLQGLITNDIEKLKADNALYAALQSAQGKFLFDFLIYEINGDIVLDVDKAQAEGLIKKLKMYKLRSKVEITPLPDLRVYSDIEEGIPDPRTIKMGKRYISDEEQAENGTLEEYETLRLEVGVPGAKDLIADDSYIMQNNFEELNGVDFEKGCYVGQEIVARTKFKSGVRKALYRVEGDLPAFGEKIKAGDKVIGEMRSSIGSVGLAQCEIAEVKPDGEYISAGKKLKLNALSLA